MHVNHKPAWWHRPNLALLLFAVSGCSMGSSYGEPSFSSSSSYSSGSSYTSAPSVPGVPQRDIASGLLVVRPDTLVQPFALHVVHKSAAEAVSLLRKTADALAAQFQSVAGPSAVLRMRGFTVQSAGHDKSLDDDDSGPLRVMVDGVVEVPLAPGQDFWQRGQLLASLSALVKTHGQSGKQDEGAVTVQCAAPKAIVKNPEAYREKLTQDWVKRARELGKLAQSATVPLSLVDCAPPGEIVQSFISFEEVGLALKTSCRIDAIDPRDHSPQAAEPAR